MPVDHGREPCEVMGLASHRRSPYPVPSGSPIVAWFSADRCWSEPPQALRGHSCSTPTATGLSFCCRSSRSDPSAPKCSDRSRPQPRTGGVATRRSPTCASCFPACLADPAAAARLSLAEQVLDGGMTPGALMKALWPQPDPNALHKYNSDQPRVPAGNGAESGRWEFGSDGAAAAGRDRDGRIVVAADEKPPPPKELPYQERQIIEGPGPVGSAPVRLVDPLTEMPGGLADHVSAAAKAAAEAVGPGRGPVYGTAVHTEFKAQIGALKRSDLTVEQSYLNGQSVNYGTPGSVRADVIEGPNDHPRTIYDLKTGDARLTGARIRNLRAHLPPGEDIEIREVRP